MFINNNKDLNGTKKKWVYNTAVDIIVEVGTAWWMVA